MTKNIFKRALSIVLCVAMLVTTMSFVLTASAGDGDNIESVTINTFDNWSSNYNTATTTGAGVTISGNSISTASNQMAQVGMTYNDLLTVADGKFTISATVQTAAWNADRNFITLGFGEFGLRFVNGGYTDADGAKHALVQLYKGTTLLATYTHDAYIYNEATVITYENGAISATQGGVAMTFDLASTADIVETDASIAVDYNLTNVTPTVAIYCSNNSTGVKKVSNYSFTANCVTNANFPTGSSLISADSFADTEKFTVATTGTKNGDATNARLLFSYQSSTLTATTVNSYNLGEKFMVNTLVANDVNTGPQSASITIGDLVGTINYDKDADTGVQTATATIAYGGNTLATSANIATFFRSAANESPFSLIFNNGYVALMYDGIVVVSATIADFAMDTFSNTDIDLALQCSWGLGVVSTLSVYAYDFVYTDHDVNAAAYTGGVAGTTGGTVSADINLPASVDHGESITLTAAAKPGYVFDGWYVGEVSGTPVSTDLVYTVTVNSDLNLIANFVENVIVENLISGIKDNYFAINSVYNTVISDFRDDGNVYMAWVDRGIGNGGRVTYTSDNTFNLSSSFKSTYNVYFNSQGRAYVAAIYGDLAIIASNSKGYTNAATADTYCSKLSVVDLGDTSSKHTFYYSWGEVGQTGTIIAEVTLGEVRTSANTPVPSTDVTVEMSKDGKLTVKAGDVVVMDAVDVSDRFDFSNVSAIVDIGMNNSYWSSGYLVKDFALTAYYYPGTVNATVYTDGVAGTAGGTVTGNPELPATVAYGETVTLTAAANSGYTFDGWYVGSVSGEPISTDLTYTATVTGDVTYIANFIEAKQTSALIGGITDTYFEIDYSSPSYVSAFANDGNVSYAWGGETYKHASGYTRFTSDNSYNLNAGFDLSFSVQVNSSAHPHITGVKLGDLAIVAAPSYAYSGSSDYSSGARLVVLDLGDTTNAKTLYYGNRSLTAYTGAVLGEVVVAEASTAHVAFPLTDVTVKLTNDGKLTVTAGAATVVNALDVSERFDLSAAEVEIFLGFNDYYIGGGKITGFNLTQTVTARDVINAIDAVGTLIDNTDMLDVDNIAAVKAALASATAMYNNFSYKTFVTNVADIAKYQAVIDSYTVYFDKSGFAAVDAEDANLFNITVEGVYTANYDTTNVTLASPNAWGAIHATTANKYNLGNKFKASIEFKRQSTQNLKDVATPSNDDNYYDIEVGALKGRVFIYCTNTADCTGTLQTVFILYYEGAEIARSQVFSSTELNLIGADFHNLTLEYNNGTVVLGCDGTDYVTADVTDKNYVAYDTTVKTAMACSYAQNLGVVKSLSVVAKPANINFNVISGAASITINGASTLKHSVTPGSIVTLTATPVTGYVFQAWVNKANDTIVSTEATLEVIANATNTYEAVCGPDVADDAQTYVVKALNKFDKVVDTKYLTSGSTYKLPEGPALKGYTFGGWLMNGEGDPLEAGTTVEVTANIIFTPVYNFSAGGVDNKYTVTIDNNAGVIVSVGGFDLKENIYTDSTAVYNDLVVVNTEAENFVGWAKKDVNDSNNVVIVSYDREYSFYAGLADDSFEITLYVVEADDPVDAKPVTNIVNFHAATNKVTFMMERAVPTSFSLVESGFILGRGVDNALSVANGELVVANGAVTKKIAASDTAANGQYMLNVNTKASGVTVYAVSYVTYVDASGNIATVYSAAVVATSL